MLEHIQIPREMTTDIMFIMCTFLWCGAATALNRYLGALVMIGFALIYTLGMQ